MQIICRGRNTGKTTELLRLSAQNNIPIVTYGALKIFLIERARELNLNIPTPMSYTEVKESGVEKVYVDDALSILQTLLGTTVEGVTISTER